MPLIANRCLAILSALLLAMPAYAQAPHSYAQPELDQMLAPIALYPDALLSQVLMAATYPLDVVKAARWSRANPGLQGDDAVRAVAGEDWDASVKSLVAFPQLLARMDEQLDWMRMLGEAFVSQEPQVMDTVQELRRRARAAGNLQSGEQMTVQQQGPAIVIQPASPQVVYVPYYDPMVVYGTWWWPAYRPVYWAPWPGYARPYHPGVPVGFWWGRPTGLSLNFFFGNCDWHRRHVRVVHPAAYYYRPPAIVNRTAVVDRGRWQPSRTQANALPPVQVQSAVQARTAIQAQPEVQARPQVQPQNQVQREERRVEPRFERRDAKPATLPQAPAAAQPPTRIPAAVAPQPPARPVPVVERREQRHAFREPARVQVQPQPQARMPAAVAPPQPRAQRHEAPRVEPRNEPRGGGRQRS